MKELGIIQIMLGEIIVSDWGINLQRNITSQLSDEEKNAINTALKGEKIPLITIEKITNSETQYSTPKVISIGAVSNNHLLFLFDGESITDAIKRFHLYVIGNIYYLEFLS